MLNFIKIDLKKLNEIDIYSKYKTNIASDLSCGFIWMWNHLIDSYYAILDDTIIIRISMGEGYSYTFPIGKNIDNMLNELINYSKDNNIPLRFFALNEYEVNYLINSNLFKEFNYSYDDRFSDYIYDFNSQLNFSGKKYKGQRNHINKFKSLYGEPIVKIITKDDINKIHLMLDKYILEHNKDNLIEYHEFEGTKRLLDSYNDINLIGAYIEYNNEIIAFSIGEIINDLLIIHVEKALKKYEGIYPTMYNSFVKLIYNTYNKDIKYINREDDSGDFGLRLSKMQYHPIKNENKYQTNVFTPKFDLNNIIELSNEDIILNKINENDKDMYYKLSTDEDINKYYGYDYKKDIYLSYPINSDSFYNNMLFDMNSGDSYNLSIRLKDTNEFVGECLLWHFCHNSVEVGIRLLKEYQNNKIGIKAYKLLTEYAYNVLKLNPIARCYKENIKSYKMIIKCGYKEINSDDEFYYFKY